MWWRTSDLIPLLLLLLLLFLSTSVEAGGLKRRGRSALAPAVEQVEVARFDLHLVRRDSSLQASAIRLKDFV